MRFLGRLAINRVFTIVSASIFVKDLEKRKIYHRCLFLDSKSVCRHHGTTMRIPLFRKRSKPPSLAPEQQPHRTQKIETLKAGRLATLALSFTSSLIEQFGPRLSGSEACSQASMQIKAAYEAFCDHSEIEKVDIDASFHSFPLRLAVYLYPLILVLLLVGLPYLGLPLFLMYLWYATRTLYFYKPISKLSKADAQGSNVHAVLEPDKDVKHTLIFTSHHDSAPLFSYNRLDRVSYAKKVALPLLLFLLAGMFNAMHLITELLAGNLFSFSLPPLGMAVMGVALLGATPVVLPLLTFYAKEGSPGAGDNLASVGMTVQLARFFHWKKSCNTPLEHTRLVFCSFDGEECGLQGSKAWYQKHQDEMKGAIVLNLDSIYHADRLTFLERDINGTQLLSSRLARRCVQIARSMGYEALSESIPRLAGGTDAAQASRFGLEATTLTSVAWDDHSKPSVYHTQDDVVSSIDVKAIEMALSVAIRLVELTDADRLWSVDEKQGGEEMQMVQSEPNLVFTKLTHR